MSQQQIIIIGAGIAGLTAAISLKKLGYKIVVYESSTTIKGIGAGLGLASNALKALQFLGLDQGISSIGTKVTASHIRDSRGRTVAIADATLVSEEDNQNFAVHRKDLHQYLYEQLEKSEVIPNKKLVNFTQSKEEVFVEFEDGTSDTADYLIATDGVGSTVRQQLLPNSKPRYAGYTCWRAIIKNPGLKLTDSSETWGKEGRFGYVALPNNLIYWYACINTHKHEVRNYTVKDLCKNFQNYYHPIPKILSDTLDKDLLQNDIVDIKPIHQFYFERILLMGDAAHATTPNMGQGACMALEDVAVLINELKQTTDVENAFQNFEKKRLKRTRFIINTSRKMGIVAQLENPILISIRNILFRNMPKAFVKRQMKILLETDIFNP
ncbi:FAD-dependent monooxygenase [Myroides guanonis]|uniref:2-polyprenyl-6-methoxyphenol hydroxylase n=1 Tax=Myroides guanonis TaxID=1150112 RepID=A0A1I3TR92_9FLAO|nr:FAD-dependent monooxygenase [Myroides guanonis]SFJ73325.1 2-polyprenyl-6-methoxyphenol hydroxylase [Myroides guanonis]